MRRLACANERGLRDIRAAVLSLSLAAIAMLPFQPSARADVFTLAHGGTVEGEILAQDESGYTIRTLVGTIKLSRDVVTKIDSAPSPFQEYEARKETARDVANDQFELAAWCDERGLRAERLKHLKRAIVLDPDHKASRLALGYVRLGALWVDGRTLAKDADDTPSGGANDAKPAGRESPRDPEKLAQAIQTDWRRRIRAISRSLLNSVSDRVVKDGRERILAIKDPLAILPLSKILSGSRVSQRKLLVEVLGGFEQDEATMNLAVLALADPHPDVRKGALSRLVRRSDDRIPGQFRKALASGQDWLIRRGAIGLKLLNRTEAVPDLIKVLTAKGRMRKEVPVRRYFHDMVTTFSRNSRVQLGSGSVVVHHPQIGVYGGQPFFPPRTEFRKIDVIVRRTEVLEALRALTSQNFGFDRAAWQQWYEENK